MALPAYSLKPFRRNETSLNPAIIANPSRNRNYRNYMVSLNVCPSFNLTFFGRKFSRSNSSTAFTLIDSSLNPSSSYRLILWSPPFREKSKCGNNSRLELCVCHTLIKLLFYSHRSLFITFSLNQASINIFLKVLP